MLGVPEPIPHRDGAPVATTKPASPNDLEGPISASRSSDEHQVVDLLDDATADELAAADLVSEYLVFRGAGADFCSLFPSMR